MAAEEDEAGSRMSMQLVLMNCLKDKKYGDALSACNSLLARFPTDAMALECKTLLTEKAELAEMPTDGEEESEEGDEHDEGGGDEDDDEEGGGDEDDDEEGSDDEEESGSEGTEEDD
jgi:cobalamin biosynthesis protein CobT